MRHHILVLPSPVLTSRIAPRVIISHLLLSASPFPLPSLPLPSPSSRDGGYSWTTSQTPSDVYLKYTDVAFHNASGTPHYLVVSNMGGLLVSADGVTWTETALGTGHVALNGVAVGVNGVAYAVGSMGNISRSNATTGYLRWTGVPPKGAALVGLTFNAVGTYDGVRAIAVGKDGLVYHTSTKGATWVGGKGQYAVGSVTPELLCVAHGNSLVAYVGGAGGTLIKTIDGGASWVSLFDPSSTGTASLSAVLGVQGSASWSASGSNGFLFHSLSALSSAVLYAGTSTGAVVRTVNGGFSFSLEKPVDTTSIYALAMYSSQAGAGSTAATQRGLIGVAGANSGTLFVKAYTPTASPTPRPTNIVNYVWSPAVAGAVGNVLMSAAWGNTLSNAVMVGYRASAVGTVGQVGVIVHTVDGGLSWRASAWSPYAAAKVASMSTRSWSVQDVASFTDRSGNSSYVAVLSNGLVAVATNTQGASKWMIAANLTTTTTLMGIGIASANGVAVAVASNVINSRRTIWMSAYPSAQAFAQGGYWKNATYPRPVAYRNWTNISPAEGTAASLSLNAVALNTDASTVIAVGLGGTIYYSTCTDQGSSSAGLKAPSRGGSRPPGPRPAPPASPATCGACLSGREVWRSRRSPSPQGRGPPSCAPRTVARPGCRSRQPSWLR